MTVTTEALLQRDSLLIVWELRAVWATIFIYFLSSVCYMLWLFVPGSRIGKPAARLLIAGALGQTATIILRMVESGQPPYQTLYESLLWFAWSSAVIYIFMERKFKGIHAGGFPVAAIACGACLYAVLGRSPGVTPLFPALQSDWFTWHVGIASMSYAVFVVAFSVEFGYVIIARLLPPHMLSRYGMDAETAARPVLTGSPGFSPQHIATDLLASRREVYSGIV